MRTIPWLPALLLLWSGGAHAGKDLMEYFQAHREGGALFTGAMDDEPFHAVLWLQHDDETLSGYYVFEHDYLKWLDGPSHEQMAQVRLDGRLEDSSAGLRISLDAKVAEAVTAGVQADFSAQRQLFHGQWVAAKDGTERAFELHPGGVLRISNEPKVELDMTASPVLLIIEDNTRLETAGYQFDRSSYNNGYSYRVFAGEPRIFALGQHYYGGRVESTDIRYLVEGAGEPFLSAEDGGGHWCAGGTGGRHEHSVDYVPPHFSISYNASSWDSCNTSHGFYSRRSADKRVVYQIRPEIGGTMAEHLAEQDESRQTMALIGKHGESIYLQLSDDNLHWQGAVLPESINLHQALWEPAHGEDNLCWLYGSGNDMPGVPTQENIDPVWRNLDHASAWQNFVQRTHHGLLSEQAWSLKKEENMLRLLLNGTEVAGYDSDNNQCYSLYVKQQSAGVRPLLAE